MHRRAFMTGLSACVVGSARVAWAQESTVPAWTARARAIHATYRGRAGTLALFGDSITESRAFWSPLAEERLPAPAAIEEAYGRVKARLQPECWSEWRGEAFGNASRTTVGWARTHVDRWLDTLAPEVAIVMFGSNDLPDRDVRGYRSALTEVTTRCIGRGTIPMLSTLPPRSGLAKEAAEFSKAVREIAAALAVPLLDYHAAILERRPDDWDGTAPAFRLPPGTDPHEALTLIAADGVHPSNPARFFKVYSDEALRVSGYGLRTAQALLAYDEVIRAVIG